MRLFRASLTIGAFTVISRMLGFVREMMIAAVLGTGLMADAFVLTVKISNFMRGLFAEGALTETFIPFYAGMRATEGEKQAVQMAEEIRSALVVLLVVISGVAIIFMPTLIAFCAPGFLLDQDKFELAVLLSRITFPYIVFISLVTMYGGILNSHYHFAAMAVTPIIMNCCMIGAMLLITPQSNFPAHILAVSLLVSGIIQYVWISYFLNRIGVSLRVIVPKLTNSVRKILALMLPIIIGSSVVQLNLMINTIMASNTPAAVSILHYAGRISELPLGMIAIIICTPLLPALSKHIREENMPQAMQMQNRALEFAMVLGLPATVALITIPYPIVVTLYQHGAFTSGDSYATLKALIAYSVGLPACLIVKIFIHTFYANQNTKTPAFVATTSIAINLFFCFILMPYFDYVVFALATFITFWIGVLWFGYLLYRQKLLILDAIFKTRIFCMIISSLVMGEVLLIVWFFLTPYFNAASINKPIALIILIASGLAAYASMLWFFKATRTMWNHE